MQVPAHGESPPREEGQCPREQVFAIQPDSPRRRGRGARGTVWEGWSSTGPQTEVSPRTASFLSLKDLLLPPSPGACVPSGDPGTLCSFHIVISARMPSQPWASVAKSWEPKGGSNPN